MDSSQDDRLARIVERSRAQRAREDRDEPGAERERRLARERVVAELPRLVSRLTQAVEALNDRLAGEGIIIALRSAEHRAASEAGYTLALAEDGQSDPHLFVSIGWNGEAHAVLCGAQGRSPVLQASVFDLDAAALTGLLLTLLEARFP